MDGADGTDGTALAVLLTVVYGKAVICRTILEIQIVCVNIV